MYRKAINLIRSHLGKRALSLLLVFFMFFSALPGQVLAQDDDWAMETQQWEETGDDATAAPEDEDTPVENSDENSMPESNEEGTPEETDVESTPEEIDEESTPEEADEESTPTETDGESAAAAMEDVVSYDAQPASLAEVQAWIDGANDAYAAAISDGYMAALAAMLAAKPHWEEAVPDEWMPAGYICQLVSDDDAFGAPYYTFFAGVQALAAARDRDPNWDTATPVATETEFRNAVTGGDRSIKLTDNITVTAAVTRTGDLTIFGDENTLTFSGGSTRVNLSGSGALTVYDLSIAAPADAAVLTTTSSAGVFCAYSTLTGTNTWTADFYSIDFTGTALIGANHADVLNYSFSYFSDVHFYEENSLTANGNCALNAVVFARNVTIEGQFDMWNEGGVSGANSASVGQFFRSVGVGDATRQYDPATNAVAYGTFEIAAGAEVNIIRATNVTSTSLDLYQYYIRSLIFGYESFLFGAESAFAAEANTNRQAAGYPYYASSVIGSHAGKAFTLERGAAVTLTTGQTYTNSDVYGYNALLLRKSGSEPLEITVAEEAVLYIDGNGAFGTGSFGARAYAPVAIMGTGSSSSNTTVEGTIMVHSANGNGWYYEYSTGGSGNDTVTIDGGTMQINANGNEGNRASLLPRDASSPDEYAAFEHYNGNAFTMDIVNGGTMLIQATGWRAMSLAGGTGSYTDKTINIDGADSRLLINPNDSEGKPTGYVQFGIAAETSTNFNLNVTNGGEMFAQNTQDSTIYTVGSANYLVSGAGSKLTLIKTGENSSGTKYSLYGSIFHDTSGALDIQVRDGGVMWVESSYGTRATITAQTYSAGQHNITVDGTGSRLTVINHSEDITNILANQYIEDVALYPNGAIAFSANTSGNITVSNGADFYAESHNPMSATIALGSYSTSNQYGLFTADHPGEIDIRNDGTVVGNNGSADIRGIALRGRSLYYLLDPYFLANLGTGTWASTSDTAKTIDVISGAVTVYERNGGFDKASFEDWGDEHVIRSWPSTTFSSMNVGTTTGIAGGVNGDAVASGSSTDDTSFTLQDYGRIYIRGISSKKTVSQFSAAGVDGAAVIIGDEITYDIDYVNYKDTTANLTITDALPSGLAYVSHAAGDSVSTDVQDNVVTWKLENIAAGGSGTVTITARVTEAAIGSVTNTARLVWNFVDGGTSTQEVEATNDVDVSSVKYVSANSAGANGEPVRYHDTITYEIYYVNNSNTNQSLQITDQMPSGVEYVGSSPTGTYDESTETVTWNLDSVPALSTGFVTVTVYVTENVGTVIVNEAKLVWEGDPGNPEIPGTETPVVETPVGSYKYVSEDSDAGYEGAVVKSGDEITYVIRYVNNTGENAGVTITDVLPAGLEFISATDDGVESGGTVSWAIPNVAAGESGTVTLIARVANSLTGISTIVNQASLVWTGAGESTDEDSNQTINPVGSAKYVSDGSAAGKNGAAVHVGDRITYEIAYINPTGAVANLTITDALAPGLQYVNSSDGGVETAGVVVWSIPGVQADGSGFVTVVAEVTGDAGATITNAAQLDWDDGSPPEEPSVENPVGSSKYVSRDSDVGIDGIPITIGDEFTYVIKYVNNTGVTADLTITDKLPTGLAYVRHTGSGSHDEATGTITWSFSNLADGATDEVTVTVKVTERIIGSNTVINEAILTWEKAGGGVVTEDPKVPIQVGAIKYIDNGAGANGTLVVVGDEITYTIRYANNTGVTADLTLTDVLPTGLTYVGSTGGGSYNDATGTVTWSMPGLTAGAIGTVTVTVKVTQDVGANITNKATITWKDAEDNIYTKDTETTNPVGSAKIVAGGAGENGAAVSIGDEITYTITYRNNTGDTADVKITDTLPAGLEYVGHTPTADGLYDEATNTVTWSFAGLSADATGEVTMTVKITQDVGAEIVNKAVVLWTDVGGTDQTPEEPSVTNPVLSFKYVSGGKGADGELVRYGDLITYTVQYINHTGTSSNVTITDALPDGVTFVSTTGGGTHSNGTVSWNIYSVADGAAGTVTVTVRVNENAPTIIVNEAKLVWSADSDNPETSETETPVGSYKYVSEESGAGYDGVSVKSGDEITYVIRYINNTGEQATVEITDVLPDGLEFVSASDNGDENSGVVTWTIANVPAGESGTVTLTAQVASDLTDISSIDNQASLVWTGAGEPTDEESNETVNPIGSAKVVAESSAAGKNGALVHVGDRITYEIIYVNQTGAVSDLTITDVLEDGLQYISSTDDGVETDGVVVWEISDVPDGGSGSVTVVVEVTEKAGATINNAARLDWGDGSFPEEPSVENPVGSTKYVSGGNAAGTDGTPVTVGDEITYAIKYVNNT
ncbi:MAG: DUF11 domain-containing protein, partial [Oscillospiraceae bacterium]|nr:DUF11 domain-containing protein [Oscillospiraceae bacterium]